MHPNLQKTFKQCKARQKVITCDNVIFVFLIIYQFNDNHISNWIISIFMTCITINLKFLPILELSINQTPNIHFILARFNFHVLFAWVNIFKYFLSFYQHTNYVLHSTIAHTIHYIPRLII
jgi:hypothetical protein